MTNRHDEIKLSREGFIANYPHFRYWKKRAAEEMLAADPLNIYIHVPFCAQKCAYCYYKTEPYKSPAQLQEYVDRLCQEVRMASQHFHLAGRPVNTVYIGGGTPTLLKTEMLARVVACLRENFSLREPEFSIEAEPRTITPKKITAYRDLGINRISIGIQSFNDEIIKLSGRNHTAGTALKALENIKQAGEMVINIDLLSGLAGETEATWAATLDTAIAAQVHNITVYKMEVYLNTEFFQKSVRHQELELPPEEQELQFMKIALEKFAAANYRPWSWFTFTREGKYLHGYATNIWKGQDCLALGPSAFGQLGHYNYQNTAFLDTYLDMINQEKLPVIRGYKLNSKDVMIKDLLLGMKLEHFDRQLFKERHGFDFCDLLRETVQQLSSQGFILLEDNTLRLTAKGILYGDWVGKRLAHSLKQYLGPDKLSLY